MDEVNLYVYYDDGGIGPAYLVQETQAAKKTHGDCVIADALTLDNKDIPKGKTEDNIKMPGRCFAARLKEYKDSRKKKPDWRRNFNFGN